MMIQIERSKKVEDLLTAHFDSRSSFATYLGSYNRAFEILVHDIISTERHVNYIAYPMLFLARHWMELGFKMNLQYFAKYAGKSEDEKYTVHDLGKLLDLFEEYVKCAIENFQKYDIIVEKEDVAAFKQLLEEVRKLQDIFQEIDKYSIAFRYPFDKMGTASFPEKETIKIFDLIEMMDKCETLFVHSADAFAKYTDYVDSIEKLK